MKTFKSQVEVGASGLDENMAAAAVGEAVVIASDVGGGRVILVERGDGDDDVASVPWEGMWGTTYDRELAVAAFAQDDQRLDPIAMASIRAELPCGGSQKKRRNAI